MAVKKNNDLMLLSSVVIVLAIGLIVFNIKNTTNVTDHAAGGADLNTASQITTTNNPDGTMGPPNWFLDFAKTLPAWQKGQLSFGITDPQPAGVGRPSSSPSGGVVSGLTSLSLTISKVEVHLAYLGTPGSSPLPSSSPSASVDRWETLDITNPTTVDLVALAKTKDISTLGVTSLADGLYTEIRLYITSASATLADGTSVTLTIPGNSNIVRIVRSFKVTAGATTNAVVDFDAQSSVIKANNTYFLKPVVARFVQS